ncbi:MAG TPA: ABC transporter permease [Caldilineaceae bacterium]|nr:ABC transporter permease [Caldilineaceae bacterium]
MMQAKPLVQSASTVKESPAPLPHFVLEPAQGWVDLRAGEVWAYRELLYFLVWRAVKVRYKQTALGVLWVVLQPLAMTLLFSLVFGAFAQIPSGGVPYPLFVMVALWPWQWFAYSLSASSTSLLVDQQLVTKVYFPRLVVPLSTVLVGLIDFAVASVVLIAMLVFYKMPVTLAWLSLPLFILLALAASVGVGLWLAALNVQYRDVQYAIPFLSQLWLFATPIAYPTSLIPAQWQLLYGLNPMVGVVEGFRWALLGQSQLAQPVFFVSVAVTVTLFVSGVLYFRRVERTFADII